MTISFSGLGSGLDTSSWIEALVSIRQQSVTSVENKISSLNTTNKNLTNLKSTYSSFLTAINKLTDSNNSSVANVFAQAKATSSNNDILGITTSSGAVQQTLDVVIKQLATNTTAVGNNFLGKEISEDTLFSSLASGNAKTGSFSFFVDNQKYSIDIDKEDTLGNIKEKMINATKSDENPDGLLTIDINNGIFSIDAGSKSLTMGSAQDKSSFLSSLALKKDDASNSYTSTDKVIDLNMNAKLLGDDSPISGLTAGDFTVGEATFKINENTTLNGLINAINSNSTAGVTASVNSVTGKLEFTSKSTGEFNISFEQGTSNFLEVAGIMNGSKLADGTQTLGKNAILTINGKQYESFSNTVSSETTGLNGLVFNLNDVTEDGKSVKVKVEQDNNTTLDAVKGFIEAFNKTMSETDSLMSSDSSLKYEISLSSMKSNLRTSASYYQGDTGTSYRTLADIGITTGKVGTSVESNTNQLVLDEKRFLEALEKDPSAVKELLVGNPENGTKGAVGNMKTIVENSMHATTGYFTTKNESLTKQISNLNTTLTRKQEQLEAYKEMLTKKFNAMDQAISKLQNQYSNFNVG